MRSATKSAWSSRRGAPSARPLSARRSQERARFGALVGVGDPQFARARASLRVERAENAFDFGSVGGAAMGEGAHRLEALDLLAQFLLRLLGGVRVAPDREIARQGALVREARARLARRGGHRIGRSLPVARLVDEQKRVDARRREPRGGGEQRRDLLGRPGDARPEQAHGEIGVLAAEKGGEPQRPEGKRSERQQRARPCPLRRARRRSSAQRAAPRRRSPARAVRIRNP